MISFIVAMDKNRVIGKENKLPWHIPSDLKFFKRVTMGHKIVMGRKTYESIGKPLPGRENIIITRNKNYEANGCEIVHSIDEWVMQAKGLKEEIFVIGGAELFKELFSYADRLYITYIEQEFEGDTYFPEFNPNDWQISSREKGLKDENNPYDYFFMIYDKLNK